MLAKPWKDRTFAYPRSVGYPDGFIREPAGVSKKSLEAKSDGRIQKRAAGLVKSWMGVPGSGWKDCCFDFFGGSSWLGVVSISFLCK
jgi:hypothetical protein